MVKRCCVKSVKNLILIIQEKTEHILIIFIVKILIVPAQFTCKKAL